jgi:hypothetical protein
VLGAGDDCSLFNWGGVSFEHVVKLDGRRGRTASMKRGKL